MEKEKRRQTNLWQMMYGSLGVFVAGDSALRFFVLEATAPGSGSGSEPWLISAVEMAPVIFLAPLLGNLLDSFRMDRGALWLVTCLQLIPLIGCFFIIIFGSYSAAEVYTLAAVMSVARMITHLAVQKRFPSLVAALEWKPGKLQGFLRGQAALIDSLAPILCGVVYEYRGAKAMLMIAFALFSLSTSLFFLGMKLQPAVDKKKPSNPRRLKQLFDVRILGQSNGFLAAAIVNMIGNMLEFGLIYMLPTLLVNKPFAATAFGCAISAGAAGRFGGSFIAAKIKTKSRWYGLMVDQALRCLSFLILGVFFSAPVVVGVLLFIGLGSSLGTVSRLAILQSEFDEATRGRAMGVYMTISAFLIPAGPLLFHVLLELLSRSMSLIVLGIISGAMFLLLSYFRRPARVTDQPKIIEG